MEKHRREAALQYGDQWMHCLRTTVTLADGAAARIAAINAFLREFRPCFLHMWEVRSLADLLTLSWCRRHSYHVCRQFCLPSVWLCWSCVARLCPRNSPL